MRHADKLMTGTVNAKGAMTVRFTPINIASVNATATICDRSSKIKTVFLDLLLNSGHLLGCYDSGNLFNGDPEALNVKSSSN